MSRWTPAHDRTHYQQAETLNRTCAPYWWVMWSPSLRLYIAFYRGPARITPLRHSDPAHLTDHARYVARALARGRPP
ncbi:hypothetical protein Q8791_06920 [Nocardiopsis sp. CT-R113]|jgi:hypothetical protein|uniref:Uncharacterized protein n=1 Tax=Nocardiopsis codii TaxID=3065942 RepID=A0ABU7K3X2_9ACTN|nr:hypothetical protein [Nocardiopsis sp. CT-R113]MEE2036950.1 hypothetical protein [Nocardiopsis sp. CT-R113]